MEDCPPPSSGDDQEESLCATSWRDFKSHREKGSEDVSRCFISAVQNYQQLPGADLDIWGPQVEPDMDPHINLNQLHDVVSEMVFN